ncbi:MAG TPA: LuxR C-terminal-related transcriptional regulator [Solirubrobacterales bacterium]|nr:LuxR C-terminal-related transcriptional regulator [Solirubrobacterales bacterium]
MMQPAAEPLDAVAQGRDALREGSWRDAKNAFERALRAGESAAALEGYAQATRWLGEAAVSLDARERAFRSYRQAGDSPGAARSAIWLAYDHVVFRGEAAVARGWFSRARRLLDGLEDIEERGWLAFLEAEVALVAENDAVRAGELAATATEIGRRCGVLDLEMLGRSLEGLAKVAAGEVRDGMALLDEASAAAVSGEFGAIQFAGGACCHLIYACERVQDVDRAAQWCNTVRGFCERSSVPQLFGFCRAHYAAVLTWRGEWNEAERELAGALEAFEVGAPALAFEALLRLADLRRRQGRLDEARAICDRIGWHPQAQLCLAEIAMDGRDLDEAADLLERFLRALSPGERLARAPAQALGVRIAVERGELEVARTHLAELSSVVADAQTDPLRASLEFSEGLLASAVADDERAREHYEDALDLWSRSGAPFEASRARVALGLALSRLGRPREAARELAAATAAFDELGAQGERHRVSAALADLAAQEGAGPRPSADVSGRAGLSARELEVLRLAAQGLTEPQIAAQLIVSRHTVHRHMANIRAKLNQRSKAGAVAKAADEGLL